jgi:cell division protein FtsQ
VALVWAVLRVAVEVRDPAAFPIRKVTVDGDFRYLAPANIRQAVTGAVRGGFFHVDVRHVREMLLGEPWVREASVQRLWPDTLHVSIVEQQPVAYWGANALLNDAADIFAPNRASFPGGLAQLDGPVGSETETLALLRQAAERLAPLGLVVASVRLSERRALAIGLRDGVTIVLGRRAVQDRLARFVAAYQRVLRANWSRVGVIDLRYTNGFSIRERAASPAPDAGGARRTGPMAANPDERQEQ